MKRINQYIYLAVMLCLTPLFMQARVYTINAADIRGDLTMELRKQCAKATYNDVIELYFGKGSYTIDGSIVFKCSTVIKGAGRDQTTIILDKGNDRNGQKAFADDTYFKINGVLKHPVTFTMSDLTIRLKEHKGIWWEKEARHAVKVYHGNKVDIRRVDSYMQNAIITNFDMRVCSNVTVTDCIISNYNNCEAGGCLWIRGEMHNINVRNNKFYKYGKDETLGIYDRVVDVTGSYVRGKANRTDIFVEDNEFYYGDYKGSGNKKDPEANCDMLFSLMTDHKKSSDCCTTRNFHMRNNKFYINDVSTRCMYIGFDPADKHSDIWIENNEIINGDIGRDYRYYHKDIEVHDLSSCGDTIHITGNNVRNKALTFSNSGNIGYMFMQTRGGVVSVDNNKIVNEVTTDRKGKPYGMQLVWCQEEGGDVTMTNNVCKGLAYIAYVGGGDGTPLFTLNARNNYFEGDTRIYSHKIKDMNLNFTNNTFKSINDNFFLQEFAPKGTVVFNNNDVTVTSGNGQFMTHWGKNSTNDYRFNRLEVKNNVIRGVRNEQELFKNITNVKKRKVTSNRISR
ncbi:MAG: hypothetical protein IKX18_05350 [Muribaculaceae bacterium]|nr:hypothetical protein [Muribaculaceae bacterium]